MCWNWLRSISPLGERGVRLLVGAEVDQLDRDPLFGCGVDEGRPLLVALADDADLDDLVLGGPLAAGSGIGRPRGAPGERDEERDRGERGQDGSGAA